MGPGIAAALTPLQCTALDTSQYISFDMYTSVGWVCVLLGIIRFILFLPGIFNEVDVSQKERLQLVTTTTAEQSPRLPRPDLLGLFVCSIIFFVFYFNLVLLETLGTPLCMDQFGWTEEETLLRFGLAFAAVGLMSLLLFGTVGPLSKKGLTYISLLSFSNFFGFFRLFSTFAPRIILPIFATIHPG